MTKRQLREKEYYEQFAASFDPGQEIDFAPIEGPISGKESRPWNSYWRTYELLIDHHKAIKHEDQARLLDFGCGPGENALRFASIGYHVSGFDISESNVQLSNKLFGHHKIQKDGEFQVSTAEKLSYGDSSFDTIVGIDILHHVDIPKAVAECHRVLKDGGIAVFREPIEVPVLESIRNSKLVSSLVPNKASFDAHITEDERKLNNFDLDEIKKIFPNMKVEKFLIFSRFDKFFRKGSDPSPSTLEKIDWFLSKWMPGFKSLGGGMVIILEK